MNHPPRSQFDDDKEIERTKPDSDDRQKIAGPKNFSVILQEDGPGLRRRFDGTNLGDVGLNGVLGDGETRLEQFAAAEGSAPHSRFSCAICWMRAIVSAASLGRPPRLRDLNFQNNRKLWRCQPRRVAGLKISRDSFQFLTRRARRTSQRRSDCEKAGFLTWRRSAFSAIRSDLVRVRSTAVLSTIE